MTSWFWLSSPTPAKNLLHARLSIQWPSVYSREKSAQPYFCLSWKCERDFFPPRAVCENSPQQLRARLDITTPRIATALKWSCNNFIPPWWSSSTCSRLKLHKRDYWKWMHTFCPGLIVIFLIHKCISFITAPCLSHNYISRQQTAGHVIASVPAGEYKTNENKIKNIWFC